VLAIVVAAGVLLAATAIRVEYWAKEVVAKIVGLADLLVGLVFMAAIAYYNFLRASLSV